MIQLGQFYESKESRTPLLNYVERVGSREGQVLADYAQINRKKRLMYLVLRTPELAGMLWDIAEDIVGKFDYVPLNKANSGRNRIINVKKWGRRIKIRDAMLAVVFDALATGEGYVYMGAKAAQIQEEVSKVTNGILKDRIYDEAIFSPIFKPVASTTMTNTHNDTNLTGYIQTLNGVETRYMAKEMLHLYFKRLAGKVEGFSLVSTIPLQLELLWLLWTNQYDLQAKGNMPDMIITAEDIKANTPALKDTEQKLRKYNMPGNAKHGTTLLYGTKYSFEKMERDTSLQFEDVGKAVTSVLASLFRYPKSRLGIKTKESASDKDSQGTGDRDYWDMISKYQDKLCDILDTQLFEPYFGVEVIFDKSYKHDTVVENTAMRMRIDNINLVNNMLHSYGQQIPMDDVIRFVSGKAIDYNTEDFDAMEMNGSLGLPMMGTPNNPKNEQLSADKKQEEANTQKNTGGIRKQ